MSIDLDYFFNHPGDLDSVARDIQRWLGCNLAPYEGDPTDLYSRFLGLELSFGEHNLETDRNLNYEDYRFFLGIRTPLPDAELRAVQVLTMATIPYVLYKHLRITGLLVFDVGTALARYEPRPGPDGEERLFDVLSDTFVRMPEHLRVIASRLPDRAFTDAGEREIIELLAQRGQDGQAP